MCKQVFKDAYFALKYRHFLGKLKPPEYRFIGKSVYLGLEHPLMLRKYCSISIFCSFIWLQHAKSSPDKINLYEIIKQNSVKHELKENSAPTRK